MPTHRNLPTDLCSHFTDKRFVFRGTDCDRTDLLSRSAKIRPLLFDELIDATVDTEPNGKLSETRPTAWETPIDLSGAMHLYPADWQPSATDATNSAAAVATTADATAAVAASASATAAVAATA